ncbi:DUF2795 domain-containing protein [Pseudonocardia oroxyli]|uniref:DUF2795 domain-containing protein n=1 Tax=Pseudonocardia oroxyli TaxID=366584 RepID=A0A1G7PXK7_PSEOR|nr:DUF2795 domain-containing protein [Pseudonocardia oroxyli]SDF91047.1 Protein of unknown function [Pseudonocardia oroxyli]
MAGSLTPEQVLDYLTEVDYPADKDTLVDAARRVGAPDEVVRALRAIPPVDYDNGAEVVRSVRLDPAPERSASLAAEQARTAAPPRVAEHMRIPPEER